MTKTSRGQFFAALLLAPLLCGCIVSREISSLQREIISHNEGIELRRNLVLSVGGGSLYLLERAMRMIDDDELKHLSQYLHHVDRVKLGIFDLRGWEDLEGRTLIGDHLLDRKQWERAIAVRDESSTFLLVHPRDAAHIRDLYVFSATDDQFVILKFQGDVSQLVALALADRHRFAQTWRVPMDGADVDDQ